MVSTVKIKDVSFDNYGSVILVTGKTGDRRIRLFEATYFLSKWISSHPYRDDPSACPLRDKGVLKKRDDPLIP